MTHTFAGTQPALTGTPTTPVWQFYQLIDTHFDTHFFYKIKKYLGIRILNHNCSVPFTFSLDPLTSPLRLHKNSKSGTYFEALFPNPENCAL